MKNVKRVIAVALMAAAVIGMIASLAGIVLTWQVKPRVTAGVMSTLQVVDSALKTTDQALNVADKSLTNTLSSISALQKTLETTAETVTDSQPMLDTLAGLTGSTLPKAIQAAQTSLLSAAESARVIDKTLYTIAGLPLVPDNLYNPPEPLETSLRRVAASLELVPSSLSGMQKDLTTASQNIDTLHNNLVLIAKNVKDIHASLLEASNVIEQYKTLLATVQGRVDKLNQTLPVMINGLAVFLSLVLVWVAVTQIGLLLQGWDLYHRE